MLRRHLNGAALPPSDWRLVEQAVQPEVETPGGNNLLLDRGVPAGQPISCVLFNFYLAELDHRLEAIPGAFSARYSDDLLFAHPSAEVVRTAAEDLERCLQDLGLRFNLAKRLDLYLTGAGRPSTDWPETIPASAVPFLGAMVRADGTVSLARKKTRRFLREIRDRTERLARALSQVGARVDELGRAVCASVNQMLIPESSPFLEADAASLLRRVITDRNQLAQLDHWIARLVLRAITEDSSAKVFRRLPLRKLRQDWGLVSLEHARNRWGREVTV
jgi:hypothetical protein